MKAMDLYFADDDNVDFFYTVMNAMDLGIIHAMHMQEVSFRIKF